MTFALGARLPYQGRVCVWTGIGLEQHRASSPMFYEAGTDTRYLGVPSSVRVESRVDVVPMSTSRRVVTSSPPLVEGGHMVIARSLVDALRDAGHDADIVVTPQNRFGRQAAAYLATG